MGKTKHFLPILAILLLFLWSPGLRAQAAQTPALRLQCSALLPDKTMEVQLLLEDAETIFGGEFQLTLSPGLTLTGSAPGVPGARLTVNDRKPGQLHLAVANDQPFAADSVLATLNFRCTEEGTPSVTVTQASLSDGTGQPVSCTTVNSTLDILPLVLSSGSLSLAPGETGSLPVVLSGSSCVAGGEFTLTYDPGLLTPGTPVGSVPNFTANVTASGTLRCSWAGAENAPENGVVCAIPFTAAGSNGTSQIKLSQTRLINEEQEALAVSSRNGSVTVTSSAAAEPVLTIAAPAASAPGQTFTASVVLDSPGGVHGLSANLRYDARVLTLTKMTAGHSSVTVNFDTNIPKGTARIVALDVSTPISGTLATLTFRVNADAAVAGTSICFSTHQIIDLQKQPMTHQLREAEISLPSDSRPGNPRLWITRGAVNKQGRSTVQVVLENARAVYGGSFRFTYPEGECRLVSAVSPVPGARVIRESGAVRFSAGALEPTERNTVLLNLIFEGAVPGGEQMHAAEPVMRDFAGRELPTETGSGSFKLQGNLLQCTDVSGSTPSQPGRFFIPLHYSAAVPGTAQEVRLLLAAYNDRQQFMGLESQTVTLNPENGVGFTMLNFARPKGAAAVRLLVLDQHSIPLASSIPMEIN